eukprot:271597-Pyramimonas_sp.AAC.1
MLSVAKPLVSVALLPGEAVPEEDCTKCVLVLFQRVLGFFQNSAFAGPLGNSSTPMFVIFDPAVTVACAPYPQSYWSNFSRRSTTAADC